MHPAFGTKNYGSKKEKGSKAKSSCKKEESSKAKEEIVLSLEPSATSGWFYFVLK